MDIKIIRKKDTQIVFNKVSYIKISDGKITLESNIEGESYSDNLNSIVLLESI